MDQFLYVSSVNSHTIMVELVDSTTGLPKDGVAAGDVTASYTHTRTARAEIVVTSLGSASAAWSSGGWCEVDATNQPGLYRFDVPTDALVAPGGVNSTATQLAITLMATGCKTKHVFCEYTHWQLEKTIGRSVFSQSPNDNAIIGDDMIGQMLYKALANSVTNIFGVQFEGVRVSAAGLDTVEAESGISIKKAIRGMAAILLGKTSGNAASGASAPVFKGAGNDTTRVNATTDGVGNRSSVTLNL